MDSTHIISVGDVIPVVVTNVREFGAFVRMPNGDSALIRIEEVAWDNKKTILNEMSVGDEFQALVISKFPDGKINLSRRRLVPNPALSVLSVGDIIECTVKSVENYGIIVSLGDCIALAHNRELPNIEFLPGERFTFVVSQNNFNEEKHRHEILLSITKLYEIFAENHTIGEHLHCSIERITKNKNDNSKILVVKYNNIIFGIPEKRLIEPFKTKVANDKISKGEEIELVYTNVSHKNRKITLSQKPIEEEKHAAEEEQLKNQLEIGAVVEAEVIDVSTGNAKIHIIGTDLTFNISKKELSPNKTIDATDEVFKDQIIPVVYCGMEKGKMKFSRKYIVEDKYDKTLYELSLDELLNEMGIKSHFFVGKARKIGGFPFFIDVMSISQDDSEENGKLLIDPQTGKNVIVFIDENIYDSIEEDKYYEFSIELATSPNKQKQRTSPLNSVVNDFLVSKKYRQKQGTPYLFSVSSINYSPVENPYEKSVLLSFKQHTSPNTNTSVANLLEEVGQNLYTSKKRMFFELLQNADDSSSESGVKVKIQIVGQYFFFTHDGYSFDKHDFESITSAAKSTKSTNKKKTGYKGIGFKSVFTNSETVLIKSGGYNFAFDKNLAIYNDFESFYFFVNDIVDDKFKQKEFIEKYSKFKREFKCVKDIPWQLLPVWYKDMSVEPKNAIFNQNENVSIALKMDNETLNEYGIAIQEVFSEPRFMLFLRNTNRVQLIKGNECYTIQKEINKKHNIVSLENSFYKNNRTDRYRIYTVDDIPVNDESFANADVLIKKEERINNRGDKEEFFVRIDNNGNIQNEINGIPDRIASSTETSISFAIRIDENGNSVPLNKDELSLYAYLPMNEHRFKFPFFVNADFIPKSDREGVQSDNPWNYYLFYIIGRNIVTMVADLASVENVEYLSLLPTDELASTSQDTSLLIESFNRGYTSALSEIKFILNDIGDLVGTDSIVLDNSGLSDIMDHDWFCSFINTSKRLPNSNINTKVLSKSIFNIEQYSSSDISTILHFNNGVLREWIETIDDDERKLFYEWLVKDESNGLLYDEVPILLFDNQRLSLSEISLAEKKIIVTEKILPIKNELIKLGFTVSSESTDNHPLKDSIKNQEEKDVYKAISESDISNLTFEERLNLFVNCAKFIEVGPETLKKWAIFKNENNSYTSLSSMFAYTKDSPDWLNDYMLNNNEVSQLLEKYLISDNDIFTSIIEPNIDEILKKTNIKDVYNYFQSSWNPNFTKTLFNNSSISPDDLITIIESSDDGNKKLYVKNFRQLNLCSNNSYDNNSIEYRIIKIGAAFSDTIDHLRSIIRIDEEPLKEYTLKDEINILVDGKVLTFSLSKIIPSYKMPSILSKVAQKFSSIPSYDEIFAQNEANFTTVRNMLFNLLWGTSLLITEEQFCFLMAYQSNRGINYFDRTLNNCIRANDESLFIRILNRSMELGLGALLGKFIRGRNATYPFTNLIDTYFNCDEFTIPVERTPSFVAEWADSDEKKTFLIQMGLHDEQSNEIIRRKSFKENKNENIWNITDRNIIYSFLKWVKESLELPLTNDNQVQILKNLLSIINIPAYYMFEDFNEAAEWDNELYHDWKKSTGLRIFIVNGLLPIQGKYDNVCLYKGKEGDYTYFVDKKIIFISSEKEPASILADVYSNSRLRCPFTKEDWNSIFLVSADLIKEKDDEIAELKRQLELAQNISPGNYTEPGTNDPKTRIEINREARLAAKDYLDQLEEYDASDWNPEESKHLVKNIIKFKGKPITLVVTSSKERKLYLHPMLFAELMQDSDNLLLNYGADKCIHSLSFEQIFKDNPNVNLIFDADVISSKEFADLANRYMYSKRTFFVIENPQYSASDVINSFGLNEKKKDSAEDVDLDFDFTETDIFNW